MLTHNTIIFDLDGTLIDPLADAAAALNHMLRCFNLPERTHTEVAAGMGRGIRNLVAVSLPKVPLAEGCDTPDCGISVDEAEKVYRDYYGGHFLDSTTPYDGIIKMLTALKAAGAKTAVLSNKAHEYTVAITDALFPGLIDLSLGETPGVPLKPDPAPVKLALERLGASADTAVYIGDTDVDMQTAANSGLHCVTCAWGLRGREFLLLHGADERFLADTPADVLRILTR